MNRHLNLFTSYAKENREFQLENDLTRAFAICLQENSLFFHEVLKTIMDGSEMYDRLFEDYTGKEKATIDIQQKVSTLEGAEHLFAVSLSEKEMITDLFFQQQHHHEYDPITDLVIKIDAVAIIFEVKANHTDCTAQLYNQAYNARKDDFNGEALTAQDGVTPVDLNWKKLMELVVKTANFEQAIGAPTRVLKDFISFIRAHNFQWLPEAPINSLHETNTNQIIRRLQTAIDHSIKLQPLGNRLGASFEPAWAAELLFSIQDLGKLVIAIYPGNTKSQGGHLFNKVAPPKFKESIHLPVLNKDYKVDICYHIKLTSFQKLFTGLWFGEADLKGGIDDLYSTPNFHRYTGRKKRAEGHWEDIAILFDKHFKDEFDWREKCKWNHSVIHSGKNQFDISFGYEVSVRIPFEDYRQIDSNKNDLQGLITLLEEVERGFEGVLIH